MTNKQESNNTNSSNDHSVKYPLFFSEDYVNQIMVLNSLVAIYAQNRLLFKFLSHNYFSIIETIYDDNSDLKMPEYESLKSYLEDYSCQLTEASKKFKDLINTIKLHISEIENEFEVNNHE